LVGHVRSALRDARRGFGDRASCVVAAILATHALLLAWIDYRNSPTIDEVAHLPAGISHLLFARFDLYRVNPPLVRSVAAIPVVVAGAKTDWSSYSFDPGNRAEFAVGDAFVKANGAKVFWYFTLARWACIPFSLVGGYFCYRWARWLYGPAPGIVAAALWSFSPNILGNAAMITPDAGAAALGVMCGYCFHRWLADPCWLRALTTGAALGFAELAKTTWIVLFPLLPALWLVWALVNHRTRTRRSRWPEARQLSAALLTAVYLINLGYGFEGSFRRLRDFKFVSSLLAGPEVEVRGGNRFAGSWLGCLAVPLPSSYLEGIDIQKSDFERGKLSFLRGEQRLGGWWHYYLYALTIKVPSGTLVLALLAAGLTARRGYSAGAMNEAVVVAPAIIVLLIVSSQTGFSRHFRYLLPAFPFAFVSVSKTARAVPLGHRSLGLVSAACLSWSIISAMAVYPHCLSYFNETVGGPMRGHSHLVDANIDWGQDLLYLARWTQAHSAAVPLYVSYFGTVDPKTAGIEAMPLPHEATAPGMPFATAAIAGPLKPGWYAISVNHLRAYRHWQARGNPDDSQFLRLLPVSRAGYSIYIYRVQPRATRP